MACIAGAEPIATELSRFHQPDYEYMHMVINLACMVINTLQHKLEALLIESLWASVYGF